jgi:aspartate kinase
MRSADSFRQILEILRFYKSKAKLVLVISAINGMTDKLIEYYDKSIEDNDESEKILDLINQSHQNLIKQILVECDEEFVKASDFLKENVKELFHIGRVIQLIRPGSNIKDIVISYGEKLSAFIVAGYLNSKGFQAQFISSDSLIITDDNFGNALPSLDETELRVIESLYPLLSSNDSTPCITGFYGATRDKKITTLGRGGSDLTAAVIAHSLRTKFNVKIIYWKDVKGFLNTDPKILDKAKLLKKLSYIEAKELAFFGSKVLHPLCLDVSEKSDILSEIRSFEDPFLDECSIISKEFNSSEGIIKAITSIYKLSMVTIESGTMISLPGTASKLFSLLGDNDINIKFISQSSSENNITFGIDIEDSMRVSYLLRTSEFFGKQWFSIKIDNDISLIAVIGAGMMNTPGIAGKVFTTLGQNNINVRAISQGSSELNITAVIDRKDLKKAISVLYQAFISS